MVGFVVAIRTITTVISTFRMKRARDAYSIGGFFFFCPSFSHCIVFFGNWVLGILIMNMTIMFGFLLAGSRLRYRSRQRGFLELDLVLGKWVEEHIHSLDENGVKALCDVLDQVTSFSCPYSYCLLRVLICFSAALPWMFVNCKQ